MEPSEEFTYCKHQQACIWVIVNNMQLVVFVGQKGKLAHSIYLKWTCIRDQINHFVQDCSDSIANTLELLQSCAKPFRSKTFIISQSYSNVIPYPCHNFNGGFVNSLAPGGFENIFQNVFFKLISWIDTLSNSCETALRSMPQNLSDDKSTLVQVMAWCRQAASHYLSQCCPSSLSPYGVTRPQWVKQLLKLGYGWAMIFHI